MDLEESSGSVHTHQSVFWGAKAALISQCWKTTVVPETMAQTHSRYATGYWVHFNGRLMLQQQQQPPEAFSSNFDNWWVVPPALLLPLE